VEAHGAIRDDADLGAFVSRDLGGSCERPELVVTVSASVYCPSRAREPSDEELVPLACLRADRDCGSDGRQRDGSRREAPGTRARRRACEREAQRRPGRRENECGCRDRERDCGCHVLAPAEPRDRWCTGRQQAGGGVRLNAWMPDGVAAGQGASRATWLARDERAVRLRRCERDENVADLAARDLRRVRTVRPLRASAATVRARPVRSGSTRTAIVQE